MRKVAVGILALLAVSFWSTVQAQTTASSRAWIGISVQTLDRNQAQTRGTDVSEGAVVTQVTASSPADRAGLQVGDVIIRFEGVRVDEASDIIKIADRYNPGDRVGMTVVRDGQRLQIPLTFGDLRDAQTIRNNSDYNRYPSNNSNNGSNRKGDPDRQVYPGSNSGNYGNGNSQGPMIGVRLEDLSNQMADYFGVTPGQGALVAEVVNGSPAERTGLRAGDVIITVDDQQVRSGRDVAQFVQSRGNGATVAVQVVRNRRPLTYNVRLTNWNGTPDTWGSGTGDADRSPGVGQGTGTSDNSESLRQEVDNLRQQVQDLQQQVQDLQRKVED